MDTSARTCHLWMISKLTSEFRGFPAKLKSQVAPRMLQILEEETPAWSSWNVDEKISRVGQRQKESAAVFDERLLRVRIRPGDDEIVAELEDAQVENGACSMLAISTAAEGVLRASDGARWDKLAEGCARAASSALIRVFDSPPRFFETEFPLISGSIRSGEGPRYEPADYTVLLVEYERQLFGRAKSYGDGGGSGVGCSLLVLVIVFLVSWLLGQV